jgi:tetratricopeptide (TPR) repeat protein
VESRNVAARLAASQDLLLRAHEAYVEAIRWRPRAGALHERLAWSLGLLDDVRRAVQGTLMPVAVAPALDGLVASAESLLPRAVDHLRQAVHWDPGNALLHLSLGRFVLGHLPPDPASQQLAGEAFHQALALDPRLLPRVAESLAQHGAAGADLYRVSVPRQPPLVVALGHELERRERPRLALAMFQHALESAATPAEQAEANLALAAAFLRRREPAAAVAHARRALVLQPADPAVFAMLGSAYEASQRWDEAEAALASALGLVERADAERGREYRGRLAGLLVRRGQAERAVQLWLLAIQQAPGDAWAQLELARLLEGRADWSGAAARYRAAQDLAPQDPGVQGEAGRAYLRHGQLREARAALEIATRSRPADASLRLDLAELYRRMGAAERAAEQYREVLSLQPDHDGARLALTGVSPAGPAGPRR